MYECGILTCMCTVSMCVCVCICVNANAFVRVCVLYVRVDLLFPQSPSSPLHPPTAYAVTRCSRAHTHTQRTKMQESNNTIPHNLRYPLGMTHTFLPFETVILVIRF
jgi:hypothetical protein